MTTAFTMQHTYLICLPKWLMSLQLAAASEAFALGQLPQEVL